MKKAVGYIREGKKRDMDRQAKEIEEYCRLNDMEVLFSLTCKDFDEAAYGNWMGRRKIDAVVVATNGDVTDNVFDFYAYRCKLQMRNSDLVIAQWSDYAGYGLYRKIFEEFTGVLVRKEFEHDPVRQKNGRIRKTLKGGYIGGAAPMGYKVEGGRLVVNAEEVPVVKFLEERLEIPVRIQNDANACAYAEWKFGAGRGTRNMVFMTFGTGLGAGLVLDGR